MVCCFAAIKPIVTVNSTGSTSRRCSDRRPRHRSFIVGVCCGKPKATAIKQSGTVANQSEDCCIVYYTQNSDSATGVSIERILVRLISARN
jgi:hypothetical protein